MKKIGMWQIIITVGVMVSGVWGLVEWNNSKVHTSGERLEELSINAMRYYCDADMCDGEYLYQKEKDEKPNTYKHQCTKCKQVRYFKVQYPYIVYKKK